MSEEIQSGPEKVKVMAQEAKEIDKESSFMEPGLKKKRGPKGPWKNKAQSGPSVQTAPTPNPEAVQEETVNTLKQIIGPVWQVIDSGAVKWAGDDERAALGKERLEIVTHTSAVCVNQYFPDALGKHAPLILLTVTTLTWGVTVFAIRRENIQKLLKEKKERDFKQAQANGAAGQPVPAPYPQ